MTSFFQIEDSLEPGNYRIETCFLFCWKDQNQLSCFKLVRKREFFGKTDYRLSQNSKNVRKKFSPGPKIPNTFKVYLNFLRQENFSRGLKFCLYTKESNSFPVFQNLLLIVISVGRLLKNFIKSLLNWQFQKSKPDHFSI